MKLKLAISRRGRNLIAGVLIPVSALIACAGGAVRTSQHSSAPSARVSRELDARVPRLLAEYEIASVGVALIGDGRVTLTKVYGEQAPGVAASNATLFNLASLTKPVTAEVILRLASSGVLSLDEPMTRYWTDPDISTDPRRERLTARIALAHQTGFPNWRGEGGRLAFRSDPGTAFGYSGEGYDYLGRYAEKRVGKSFEALAQEYVFGPIGMKNTSYSARGWMRGRLAIPLDSAGRWGQPQVRDSADWSGANNLITTVGDYAAFVVSVMNGDRLSKAMAAEHLRPASGPQPPFGCKMEPAAQCPRAMNFALGWIRLDYESGPIMLFLGMNERPGGEWTLVYFEPQARRGVIVLTSGRNGQRLLLDVLDVVEPASPIAAFLRQR
ncbi:MAG TPA: serine hydrolase domain-containing protein [Gemmatimonadaceae bacterium]|nr:serine hydrolase domain-containing protein [Gemmatimonadaceae bacterium]